MPVRNPLGEGAPASAALALLRELPAERIGVAVGARLELARPIPKFRIDANFVLPRANLDETAYLWGWRFFIVAGSRLLTRAVDVRPGRDAGQWRAGMTSGEQLARQLAIIDRLGDDARTAGLRFLDAPGLDWSGVWIAGENVHRLISLGRGQTIAPTRLMGKLRRTGRRQQAAAEARADRRNIKGNAD